MKYVILVLEKVRSQIQARGAKTIRGLGRTFRNFDSFDGNHKIDREEFYSGLCEIQVRVTRDEANTLMALFDTDGDGYVNFDEFLVGIRVSVNSNAVAPSAHPFFSTQLLTLLINFDRAPSTPRDKRWLTRLS